MPNITIKKSSLSKRVYDWSHECCGGEKKPILAKSVATTLAYLVKTCQIAVTLASVAALLDLALHIPLLAHAINHVANMRTLSLIFGTGTAAKSINAALKTAEKKENTTPNSTDGILAGLEAAAVKVEPVAANRSVEKVSTSATPSRVASTFFSASTVTKAEIKSNCRLRPGP